MYMISAKGINLLRHQPIVVCVEFEINRIEDDIIAFTESTVLLLFFFFFFAMANRDACTNDKHTVEGDSAEWALLSD